MMLHKNINVNNQHNTHNIKWKSYDYFFLMFGHNEATYYAASQKQ